MCYGYPKAMNITSQLQWVPKQMRPSQMADIATYADLMDDTQM